MPSHTSSHLYTFTLAGHSTRMTATICVLYITFISPKMWTDTSFMECEWCAANASSRQHVIRWKKDEKVWKLSDCLNRNGAMNKAKLLMTKEMSAEDHFGNDCENGWLTVEVAREMVKCDVEVVATDILYGQFHWTLQFQLSTKRITAQWNGRRKTNIQQLG